MNSQQRRKQRRLKLSHRKYNKGDKVRIDHKLNDDFDTMKSHTIVEYGWNGKEQAMLYSLSDLGMMKFQDRDLVHDTKKERRKIK